MKKDHYEASEKSAALLVSKSLLRNRAFAAAVAVCCVVTGLLLSLFPFFSSVFLNEKELSIENTCGHYDFLLSGIAPDDFGQIAALPGVEGVCGYTYAEGYDGEDAPLAVISTSEDFLFYSSFAILSGRFPVSDSEILCEPWMLRRYGIGTENMVGSKVTVNGKEYSVSGTVAASMYDISSADAATVIVLADRAGDTLMVDLTGNAVDRKEIDAFYAPLVEKWADLSIEINEEKLANYEVNGKEDSVVLGFLYVIGLIASAAILSGISLFFLRKNENQHRIFAMLGIPGKTVFGAFLAFFAVVSAASALLCGLIFFLVFYVISPLCSLPIGEYLLWEVTPPFYEFVLWIAVYFAVTLLSSVLTLIRFHFKVKHGYGVDFRKKNQTSGVPSNRVFFRIARNNLRSCRALTGFTVAAVSLSMILFCGLVFNFSIYLNQTVDYGNTKFRVQFDELSRYNPEVEERDRELVRQLLADDYLDASVRNIYYTTLKIDKEAVSRRYADYLGAVSERFNILFNNHLSKTTDIPVGIISVSDFKGEIDLSGCEGKLYSIPANIGYRGFSDTSVQIKVGEERTITPEIVHGAFPLPLFTNTVFSVLVVGEEDFAAISENRIPTEVYIAGNVSEDYLLKYTKGHWGVGVESLEEKSGQGSYSALVLTFLALFSVCLAFTMTSLLLDCLLRISINRKEYAAINAIGVPLSRIVRIPIYEFSLILAAITAFSAVGTYLVSKAIIIITQSEYLRRDIPFPTDIYLLLYAGLLAVMMICGAIAFSVMRKSTAAELISKR